MAQQVVIPADASRRSRALAELLVALNPRGMAQVQRCLDSNNFLSGAQLLLAASNNVVICTGFPVADTFETDGPAGALALYEYCEQLGLTPWLLAGDPLLRALGPGVRACSLTSFDRDQAARDAQAMAEHLEPTLLIMIERPGAAADGRYYNITGRDITDVCRPAEPYVELLSCPVIGIGDGGNEIGMAKAGDVLSTLDIQPAASSCDELLVADVSNWAAYGLIAMTEYLQGVPEVLAWLNAQDLLDRLVHVGAVDGVTHEPVATEDGLPPEAGHRLILAIQQLFASASEGAN